MISVVGRFWIVAVKRCGAMVLEEPYRLFFPLGVLAGVWGVLMWPLFYGGHLGFYPGEAHARLMTGGFMGAFVAGFLGTAYPRLTGSRRWRVWEFAAVWLCWAAMVAAHAGGHVRLGDVMFSAMVALLVGGLVVRWAWGGRDTPPPGFVLVFAGLAGAAGAAAWLASGVTASIEGWRLARLWLFQGFLLLPLMGIGPYVLPRFFGMPSGHSFETSASPPPGWWPRALAAVAAGSGVVAGFAMEAWGMAAAGQILRGLVVVVWFGLETPVFRKGRLQTTPATAVRWSLVSLAAGLWCAALWPEARVGSLHLFFVSGLGLVTLAVGTRVVLGHAGRHDLLSGKIVWLRWVIGLAVLAAATRMTSDFLPQVRVSHHVYAAWTWALAGAVWLAAVARFLWREDPE